MPTRRLRSCSCCPPQRAAVPPGDADALGRLARVFGRSKGPVTEPRPSAAPTAAEVAGKGRPTPKRRVQERGRRRAVAAPRTRKEALRADRQQRREQRAAQVAALKAGDERNLPPRDRGPVRRYARDVVDSRRTVAEFFLPFAVLILVLSFSRSELLTTIGSTLWLGLVVLIALDSVRLVLGLRRGLARTFPDASTKGAVPYALMRSMQIRRFRLPPPRLRGSRRRLR